MQLIKVKNLIGKSCSIRTFRLFYSFYGITIIEDKIFSLDVTLNEELVKNKQQY